MAAMGGHLGFSKFLFVITHLGTWVYLPWKFHGSPMSGSQVIEAPICCKSGGRIIIGIPTKLIVIQCSIVWLIITRCTRKFLQAKMESFNVSYHWHHCDRHLNKPLNPYFELITYVIIILVILRSFRDLCVTLNCKWFAPLRSPCQQTPIS